MKKSFIFAAILSSPAIAHEAEPQTEFFKTQLTKNPLTSEVLNWCHLAGLETEEECKNEMYEKNGSINSVRLDAAAKCVDKSGFHYLANLDNFVRSGLKDPSLVGHGDPRRGNKKHLSRMIDPANPKEGEHYYFFPSYQRVKAGEIRGNERVELLKKNVDEKASTTDTLGGAATVILEAVTGFFTGSSETELSAEKSKTRGPLTTEEIKTEWYKGFVEGYGRPDFVRGFTEEPDGYCVFQGKCVDMNAEYSEHERMVYEYKDFGIHKAPKSQATVAESPTTPNPSPATPAEVEKPGAFDPFTSGTATGGIKIEKDPADKKPKDNSTPLGPQDTQFLEKMKLCLAYEENEILKDEGVKHKDPNAESNEEKRARAEQQLQQGFCDETYWGVPYCQAWKHEFTKTTSSTAAADAETAYNQAMREFQSGAGCNEMILGFAFCHAAGVELNSHRLPQSPEDAASTQPGGPNLTPMNPVDPSPEPMSGTDGVGAPSCPEWNPNCGR